jgi:histidine triad (HIT) family protein
MLKAANDGERALSGLAGSSEVAGVDDCLFCKIANGEIPVTPVFESVELFAFNDIAPVAPTHILIVPKWHYANIGELAANAPELTAKLHGLADQLASKEGLAGYRTVFNTGAAAGQSVFHVHLHLLGGRDFTWPPG